MDKQTISFQGSLSPISLNPFFNTLSRIIYLTHFSPLSHFYTPWFSGLKWVKTYGLELLWNLSFFQIAELQEIEDISTSVKTPESTYTFRQANIKMNIMVFKRNVFESRKRPKGVLRPKIKPLLKDIITVR